MKINEPMLPIAACLEFLKARFWEEIDALSSGLFCPVSKMDNKQVAAFALGLRDTFTGMIERLHNYEGTSAENPALQVPTDFFRHGVIGALGEVLHRRQMKSADGEPIRALLVDDLNSNPTLLPCKGRNLNAWLCQVRNYRITLRSQYDDTWLQDFRTMRREVEAWRNRGVSEDNYSDYETLLMEIKALVSLESHLRFDDPEWRRENAAKTKEAALPRMAESGTAAAAQLAKEVKE